MNIKSIFKATVRAFGFEIVRFKAENQYPPDTPARLVDTYHKVRSYTMTSAERIFALCEAVRYVHENRIPGDIVECGVWKGGSMMAVADTLIGLGDISRNLHLFDTFTGMSPPSEFDVDAAGAPAETLLNSSDKQTQESVLCRAALDVVKQALKTTGYPPDKIKYIPGMVEDTIPANAPRRIALLRLDTDWYESTKHELEHLFPRLAQGGVLIIDDYGHWQGAKKAVDEYIDKPDVRILLNKIDYAGRIAVKVD
jgi:O-methyltransferase